MLGDDDCDVALCQVEYEGGDAEALGSRAGNVGGSDVAAASGSDVLLAEDFDEDVAEWDGTQQVGERDGDEPGVHCLLDEFSKSVGGTLEEVLALRGAQTGSSQGFVL